MNIKNNILLPGLDKQVKFLLKNYAAKNISVLILGSASEEAAKIISEQLSAEVNLVVEDYESLLNSNLVLANDEKIRVSLMDFEATDFCDNKFDLIYAQASISKPERNKIIKELKRILKDDGHLCIGEIVSLKKEAPRFILDIFENSNLQPLFSDELANYFKGKNFVILNEEDFSSTLENYFKINIQKLDDAKNDLTENEKTYYKKLINKINHESNVYLKLGGDKFIGFKVLLLQKAAK